ncbi:MAG: hypothetical protein AVDCRST_MAG33-2584, partial [uncultured Thermomicrobiales bacterium]
EGTRDRQRHRPRASPSCRLRLGASEAGP